MVEVKHWRSEKGVTGNCVQKFIKVVVNERRDAGLFLATYGYASNAFEQIAAFERHKVRLGKKDKVVSLCRTYMQSKSGLVVPPSLLPQMLFADTL